MYEAKPSAVLESRLCLKCNNSRTCTSVNGALTGSRVKRSAETRGNAREIDGFPRYFYSGFSRNLAIHRPETVQFRGVFSTEWMETINACKVLMLVVRGVARCSTFFFVA